jgi:hypothetical protein
MTDKLLEDVQRRVAERPGDCGELLKAVADGLADYERAQVVRRNGLADRAMLNLIAWATREPSSEIDMLLLIDVAWHQFPKGIEGHAQIEVKFWSMFRDHAAKKDSTSIREWIQLTRGADVLAWWARHVVPHQHERGFLTTGDKP